ncbi:hypothetical protein [Janibacter sp. UYMM211]|uniref:hypothetical protein n=1 Tax=Janibacter sp. UYMM211 TaxID=3156342 RepID=UPI0033970B92
MNTRLQALMIGQAGVCTSTQARRCETSEADLAELVRRGELVRVRRDAYVAGEIWSAATPEARLALRARAVMLGRPRSSASHQAALALHGLPLWGVDLSRVDLVVEVDRLRHRDGVRLHPSRAGESPVRAGGVRCVPVAVAVAQVGLEAGVAPALVPLDHALRTSVCTREEVAEAFERRASGPLRRERGRSVLALADPASESPGETRTRLLLTDMGVPFESQVDVRGPDGRLVGRVDFLVSGKVVVEFDGLVKYEGAQGREALVLEKRREDSLRSLGLEVVRLVWSDLDHPLRVAQLISAALVRSD